MFISVCVCAYAGASVRACVCINVCARACDQPLVTKGQNQWAKRLTQSSTMKRTVKTVSSCGQCECARARVELRAGSRLDSRLTLRALKLETGQPSGVERYPS